MGNIIDPILFQPPEPSQLKQSKLVWLNTSTGSKIPAFHIEYRQEAIGREDYRTSSMIPPITILYSHANAEDLGCIYPWCKFLSKQLRVNIFAYDYTGYGLAMEQGPPSETQCYADIDAAYNFLVNILQIPSSQIVLYGRSIGSGPSCYLASRTSESVEEDTVGGLILHAPFLSIYRIVIESGCTLIGDQFPNVDFCPSVESPTLLIHGKKDKVVPISHSQALHNIILPEYRAPPLFVDEMGHNNVQVHVRQQFVDHVNAYLNRYVRSKLVRNSPLAINFLKRRKQKRMSTDNNSISWSSSYNSCC